ncbi:ABC transporter permease [Lachnoclostridium phocaeense]|uniref:ABC transporter permease n=1 Tax=Lachnoclostridium phocaeense TaxID=1871021 RepID=UPI00248DC7FB|nr:ABC transporter permease [Lachnoclostridium phocaeense]
MKKILKKYFFRDFPSAAGTLISVSILLFMIIGPLVSQYDPLTVDMGAKLVKPGAEHIFGTDEMGRDLFTRLAYGAWYSMGTALAVVLIAAAVGIIVGGIAGYVGGWFDNLVMRICDIFLSFPQIFLAMIIAAAIGAGIGPTIFALAVSWWPNYARMVRGMVIVIKEKLYVESAKAIGMHPIKIIFVIIIPQTMSMVIPQITMGIGNALISASGLSFIGLGAQMPTPEWGAMISQGSRFIFNAPYYVIIPGLFIFLAVLGFSLLGDSLQEATNPELNNI